MTESNAQPQRPSIPKGSPVGSPVSIESDTPPEKPKPSNPDLYLPVQRTKGRPKLLTAPVEFPATVTETLQFLKSTLQKSEVFVTKDQRMTSLKPSQLATVVTDGLVHLEQLLLRQERQKDLFMTKRFGTVFRTLDFDSPSEEQVVIIEVKGERNQGIVRQGSVLKWTSGIVGDRICALNQVERWRPCLFSEKPANTSSVRSTVLEALERGRAVKEGAKL